MTIAIKHREPNGRHQRQSRTKEEEATMKVVMDQPHRKGSRFPEHEWRAELFGRMILDRSWGFDDQGKRLRYGPAELYDAGNRFKREYQAWQRAKASRRAWANENRPAPRSFDEERSIQIANEAIARYGKTVEVFASQPARVFEAATNVILEDQPEDWSPGHTTIESTYDALWALAEYYAR
jgi:hypothetical protein